MKNNLLGKEIWLWMYESFLIQHNVCILNEYETNVKFIDFKRRMENLFEYIKMNDKEKIEYKIVVDRKFLRDENIKSLTVHEYIEKCYFMDIKYCRSNYGVKWSEILSKILNMSIKEGLFKWSYEYYDDREVGTVFIEEDDGEYGFMIEMTVRY